MIGDMAEAIRQNGLDSLRLQHFRSYIDESFEFEPGVNIIVGPNASGKTNLLEAILVLSRGVSYRAKDLELIQFNEPWARLDSHLLTGGERTLKLTREPAAKHYEIDEKNYQRLTLNHTLPVVLFEPNHLQLLAGGPERRRNYLDDLLEQLRPGYGTLRRQYRRTLAQRNALLKRPGVLAPTLLFPWNVRLSQLAGQLVRARSGLAQAVQGVFPALYTDLSQAGTTVALAYAAQGPTEAYESFLLHKLEVEAELDRQRGFTGGGPHREDFVVTFDGHPAAETASRGEVRTAMLALKTSELQLLREARGSTPLLLLDDVFSELDGKRRHALTAHLSDYQTFITTTDADVVVRHFTGMANVIPVS
jgi:DNA replication and repair protein RecF